jgi:Uma2 family endonuclease
MAVQFQIGQIEVLAGQRTILHGIDWREFEQILDELGENRASRIAYANRTLEVMMPLPEHEVDKELIGDMVKALLDRMERDYECFGSTTFKKESMNSGIEPDNCFYIENHEKVRGKRRLNLNVDPPPDLAIEIDVTSKTQIEAYARLGVAELWCYSDRKLQIYTLHAGIYVASDRSPTFANLDAIAKISEFVEMSLISGRGTAMRTFRAWMQLQLG